MTNVSKYIREQEEAKILNKFTQKLVLKIFGGFIVLCLKTGTKH